MSAPDARAALAVLSAYRQTLHSLGRDELVAAIDDVLAALDAATRERDALRAALRYVLEDRNWYEVRELTGGQEARCKEILALLAPKPTRQPGPGEIDAEMARQHAESKQEPAP